MYNTFSQYLDDNPDCEYNVNLSDSIKLEKQKDEFVDAINLLPQKLNLSDEELAERFHVGLRTFEQWKNGPFPYPHIQKEIILFLNCTRIEILICNQCDKKKISSEMNNLTCKVCCGEK